jgi:hypothetical protein
MEYLAQSHDNGLSFVTTLLGPTGGYTGAICYVGEIGKLGYSEKADDSREWEINIEVMDPSPDPSSIVDTISNLIGIDISA